MTQQDLSLHSDFFQSIAELILEARQKTYQAVNFVMVETYRTIGKMIVEQEQQGNQRAEYGKYLINELSNKLTFQFGKGFSERNIWNMKQFYITFPILHSLSAQLTRTHYKVLMRIEKSEVRDWYSNETIQRQLSVRQLERMVYSFSYERVLANKENLSEELPKDNVSPKDILKDPYILEFTGIESSIHYYETDLEKALIDNLEHFLLELGKGFTFYARQKHIQTETSDFFIDLVFYNYHLKCFLIIELKTDKLSHQDIGQLDMYVRMFDDLIKPSEDNPTIVLILCAEKDETIVKYSVLNDNKNIFASKYQLYLPTEAELKKQIDDHKILRETIHIDDNK